MHFSYRGFEQHNGARQFTFLGVNGKLPDRTFHFTVDLTLLTQHGVNLQEIPGLCVQILTRALAGDGITLEGCGDRALVGADLVTFTAPRRALALARANKKGPRVTRTRPSQASQPFGPIAAAAVSG
jgi:hypothetical protein